MADVEKVIKGLHQHCECSLFYRCGECPYYAVSDGQFSCKDRLLEDALAMLKEQPQIVRCKDCDNRECDGRAGTIVCGITGDSHSRLWFCADGERKEGK